MAPEPSWPRRRVSAGPPGLLRRAGDEGVESPNPHMATDLCHTRGEEAAACGLPDPIARGFSSEPTYWRVPRAMVVSVLKTRSRRPTKSASYCVRRKSVKIWTSRGVF